MNRGFSKMTSIVRRPRDRIETSVPVGDADGFIQRNLVSDIPGVRQSRQLSCENIWGDDRLIGADRPCRPAHSVAKRSLDVIAATCSLLVFLPGLLAIALAIKLTSPGPVLFRQRRYGLHNKIFEIYKFRTMYSDKGDDTGVTQTCRGDLRVTHIGRLLRRTNLDELPQLLNVIRGDMSLVGPRPHVVGMLAAGLPYEILVPNYFERHRVRPGLTGLAQARGFRGSTEGAGPAKIRIDLDLEYIQNWSFALDVRLIVETVWTEFLRAGNGI
jgi:lipopolysaccharide/colanic/teichoic acid biosynthesis glycosyltransferase